MTAKTFASPATTDRVSAATCACSCGASLTDGKIEAASEAATHLLVDRFYEKVRVDDELGPIFARSIPGDWGPHLATMRDFWSSIMLTSGRYHGNPVAVHGRLEGMKPQLFAHWLTLFAQTCQELFSPELRRTTIITTIMVACSYGVAFGAIQLWSRPRRSKQTEFCRRLNLQHTTGQDPGKRF